MHHRISMEADMPIYFADPHSPWQRGSNENTNGLLRQYFPKGTSLRRHTTADLAAVARSSTDDRNCGPTAPAPAPAA